MATRTFDGTLSLSCDMRRSARLMRVATACFIGLSWAASPVMSWAADKLYYFVDENGTPHFSNVPADKRYRPYLLVHEEGPAGVVPPPPARDVPAPTAVDFDMMQQAPDPDLENGQPGNEAPGENETAR